MPASFIPLRVHSDYSLGRGTSKIKDLIKQASALGYPAMALTDHENMHGALQFSDYAPQSGLQPILGVQLEASFKDQANKNSFEGSILFLAQNERGYTNICRIMNLALRPGRRSTAISRSLWMTLIELQKAGDNAFEGVIAVSGAGCGSLIGKMIEKNNQPMADLMVSFLKGRFHDRFYLEICRNGEPSKEELATEHAVLGLALKHDLPIVATSDVWYATEDRHDAYEILGAVSNKTTVTATASGLAARTTQRFHLRSPDEMTHMFRDLPEALEHSLVIAQRCAFKAGKRNPILPPFPSDANMSEADEMRRQAREGLEIRFEGLRIPADRHPDYRERLEYELAVIERMGFAGYFLIVADFIKHAKANGIPVGPGRGSGAGSVVAWALTITDIDPLPFGLLFERFLNPDRVSMPDFDVDFCQDRRQEVIDYVKARYGEERVAQIVTFMEVKSKTAIRDVARVLSHETEGGLPQMRINELCTLIPKSETSPDPKPLKEAYASSQEFRDSVESSPTAKAVFENGQKIEGLFRNASAHAAGIIIAGEPLTRLVPVGFDQKTSFPVVQFNMKDAEKAGLVKFDFLGLKTLSIIREALEHIQRTKGVTVDFATQSYDDPPTYAMLAQGLSNGTFQLESDGMKRVLRDIRPTQIEDLIAVVSLYRPGPMDMIPTYARRKNGLEEPIYPEPAEQTRKFLAETYGIMVYQEQVMQVAQVVAGYSLGGADLLRRAMGKKIKEEMDQQKATFVAGAVERGTPEKKAAELFDLIEKFSGYGFNKSHAAAYAVIAFRTAWLKCHHPCEFFAALMSYETADAEKMALIKQDMDHFGVQLLPPDINASHCRFRPERMPDGQWAIRFGFTAVKTVADTVSQIVAEREARGPYRSLEDFHARAGQVLNSGQTLKLVESGAFDSIAPDLSRQAISQVLTWLAKSDRNKGKGKDHDLFGDAARIVIPEKLLATPEWPNLAELEFHSVGFFFRQHPLHEIQPRLSRSGVRARSDVVAEMNRTRREVMGVLLCGLVEVCTLKETRSGNRMLSVKLAELNDSYWVNITSRYADVTQLKHMLSAQQTARRPVVIEADFGFGRERGDAMIWGRTAHEADEYLMAHTPNSAWNVTIDLRKAAASQTDWYRENDIPAKLAELDRQAFEDKERGVNPSEVLSSVYRLLGKIAVDCEADLFRNLEGVAEVSDKETAVSIRVGFIVQAGPFTRVVFIKRDQRRWLVNRNTRIAIEHNSWTDVEEVADDTSAPRAA